jgi:hypothetical protein
VFESDESLGSTFVVVDADLGSRFSVEFASLELLSVFSVVLVAGVALIAVLTLVGGYSFLEGYSTVLFSLVVFDSTLFYVISVILVTLILRMLLVPFHALPCGHCMH